MQNQIQENSLYTPTFPSSWDRSSLYDLAFWINGRAFKNSDFSESGLPILKITEIKNGVSNQTNYTSKKFDDSLFVKPGDILFSWSGTPETSIDIVSWKGVEGWLNQHTFRVEQKDVVDKKFFYYLLRYLKKVFIKIASNKKTTGLGHVTGNDLKTLAVGIPKKPYQVKIASILSGFDDKIELNNKIIKNLEEMAQAIFKEWFVKFKFPGYEKVKMVDSELGKIPEGWKIGKLGKLINLDRGVSYNGAGLTTNGLPMINLGCFLRGGKFTFENLKFYSGRHTQNHLVKEGDIVIANTDITQNREIIGNPAIVNEFHQYKSFLFTHHVFAMRNNSEYSNYFFYFLLRTPSFRNRAAGFATGTNVLALPKDALLELQIVLPLLKIASMFSEMATGVIKMRTCCESENQKLAEMRDLLLPKLMKGEIRV